MSYTDSIQLLKVNYSEIEQLILNCLVYLKTTRLEINTNEQSIIPNRGQGNSGD